MNVPHMWPHLHLTKLHNNMVADEKRSCQIGYRISCLDCCYVKRLNRTGVTGAHLDRCVTKAIDVKQ